MVGPIVKTTATGDENVRTRMGNRKFYGWMVFAVRFAEMNGRRVVLSPTNVPYNRYHCDLFLPNASEEYYRANEQEWFNHRNQLCADLAQKRHSWKERSHGSGA